MVSHELVWTQKYAPKTEKDIVGNPSAVQAVDQYLMNFGEKTSRKDTKSNAIILVGPPGTGKTATVYVMASKYDYELLEINASDVRNEENIRHKIGVAAMKRSMNKKGAIILVDEVDGISGVQDRGGIGALLKIIKETKNPIILTANDLSDQKFSTLKRNIREIKFKSIQKATILKVLQKICKLEHIEYDDQALELISENVGGDLRAAINDLQSVAAGRSALQIEDLHNLHQIRDEEKTIFEALRAIFHDQNVATIQRILWQVDISTRDFELLMQRINEIIPEHMQDPEELANAFQALSNADIVWGEIKRKAEKDIWRLFPYFSLELAAGVSLARKTTPYKFVNYYAIFPRFFFQNIGKLRRGDLATIAEKIRNMTGLSVANAVEEYLPFLSIIFQYNPEIAKRISEYFNLEKKEEQFIKKFWK